jgi:hypothetical protein
MTEHELVPPEIAGAIVQVMTAVKKLGKSAQNTHGGYKFASIDDFLEAMNPLCAEAGLFFLLNEIETEVIVSESKEKRSASLRIRYEITICHSSGAAMSGITRNVTVIASGAQAYGSAQSYVLKQFMRSLFQIPTGDADDPDFHAPEAFPPQSITQSLPKAASRALYAELQQDIDSADSADALAIWKARRKADILSLPKDWLDEIGQRYSDKLLSFAPPTEPTYDRE